MNLFRFITVVSFLFFFSGSFNHAYSEFTHTFGSGANQFNMTFVPIGNPGNVADTTGSPNPAGAVSYKYLMGKYEVSEDMIEKYNAEYGTANGLAITKDTRGTDKPATSVSWNEAARFVNWLNTSTGSLPAYKFTTSGVNDNIALWTPVDTLDYNAANPFRSLRTNYVLPNFDEWYKAAYYDPNTSTYYDFATGSNTAPTPVAGGTIAGTAVYSQPFEPGPADVNNAGGLSPFGVMGLVGNVQELQETETDLVNDSISSIRGNRGGSWIDFPFDVLPTDRGGVPPGFEFEVIGFRVASLDFTAVPEPSSMLGAVTLGLVGSMYRRRRKRQLSSMQQLPD
jgi:formylglycine-generating enzyme required for sulfatase activity